MNINNAYGDIEIYSPQDELMFRTNQKKLDFYLKKNLAEEIGDKKYRLLFEPNGKGFPAARKFGKPSTAFSRK